MHNGKRIRLVYSCNGGNQVEKISLAEAMGEVAKILAFDADALEAGWLNNDEIRRIANNSRKASEYLIKLANQSLV